MTGHIRKEHYGMTCDWCGQSDATIVLEGRTAEVFRICIKCSIDVLAALKEEVKAQRLRYLIDTGRGIVLDEEEDV